MPYEYFQGTPGAAAERLRRQVDALSDCRGPTSSTRGTFARCSNTSKPTNERASRSTRRTNGCAKKKRLSEVPWPPGPPESSGPLPRVRRRTPELPQGGVRARCRRRGYRARTAAGRGGAGWVCGIAAVAPPHRAFRRCRPRRRQSAPVHLTPTRPRRRGRLAGGEPRRRGSPPPQRPRTWPGRERELGPAVPPAGLEPPTRARPEARRGPQLPGTGPTHPTDAPFQELVERIRCRGSSGCAS